jgi:hypothetical protein
MSFGAIDWGWVLIQVSPNEKESMWRSGAYMRRIYELIRASAFPFLH